MDVLVLYYSFSGHTRAVSEALAKELGADLREIECPAYRRWYGPLAMLWDIATRHRPRVLPVGSPGTYYDLIVVGGPVWAAQAAPPVMSVLDDCGRHFRRAALFVTCSGTHRSSRPEDAITEMSVALGDRPAATKIFREAEIGSADIATAVAGFGAELRAVRSSGGATRAQPRSTNRSPLDWPTVLTSPSGHPLPQNAKE